MVELEQPVPGSVCSRGAHLPSHMAALQTEIGKSSILNIYLERSRVTHSKDGSHVKYLNIFTD